jgi:hypothetical protein
MINRKDHQSYLASVFHQKGSNMKRSFDLFEHILPDTANRAYPIVGKILESGPGGYVPVRVSLCRIIYVTASHAAPLRCHSSYLHIVNGAVERMHVKVFFAGSVRERFTPS